MATVVATSACVVRPTHTAATRSKAASRATTSSSLPKSAAMSGLNNAGSAPAFLGAKPAQLSAGLAIGRRGGGAGCRSVATMGLFGLGLPELVVIGGVAAVLFGPSKLPELGKSLGKTVKSFQEGANVSASLQLYPGKRGGREGG